MKLFYSKGACSFAPHVILRELDIDFELVSVDTPTQKYGLKDSGEFQKYNPGGKIPALVLNDEQTLTECSAILVYLADLKPELELFPKVGTFERIRGLELLNNIAMEWHKQITFLFMRNLSDELRNHLLEIVQKNLDKLNNDMKSRDYIFGKSFSVLDAYMFVVLEWVDFIDPKDELKVSNYPHLKNYLRLLNKRPAILEALDVES